MGGITSTEKNWDKKYTQDGKYIFLNALLSGDEPTRPPPKTNEPRSPNQTFIDPRDYSAITDSSIISEANNLKTEYKNLTDEKAQFIILKARILASAYKASFVKSLKVYNTNVASWRQRGSKGTRPEHPISKMTSRGKTIIRKDFLNMNLDFNLIIRLVFLCILMFCMDDKNIDDFCKQDYDDPNDDPNVQDIYKACFEKLNQMGYIDKVTQIKGNTTHQFINILRF